MPAIDSCEPQVIRAFEKARWIVEHQPFSLRLNAHERLFADLRLRRGTTTDRLVIVEVKCFADRQSQTEEFYQAVGQYLTYRTALTMLSFDIPLYLALPLQAYSRYFRKRLVQEVTKSAKIAVVVVDIQREEIVAWNR